jgi:pimeloyl-ACP methyl ester carboxylesterase/class 3 adenylate cyclase
MVPETRYVGTTDGVHVAYQVVGSGPYDLVYHAGWLSNVDLVWDVPWRGDFLRRLAGRSRLILMDRRGTGVSDRPATVDALSLELAAEDTLAVLDAAGSVRSIHFGFEEGAAVSVLLAAAHPDRVSGVVLFAPVITYWRDDDYPWGWTQTDADEWLDQVERNWGTLEFARYALEGMLPAEQLTPDHLATWARYWRLCTSPSGAVAIERMARQIDVRSVLPAVRVPTLVMVRAGDEQLYQGSRWIAEHIPGARYLELPGHEHPPFLGDGERVLGELDRFVASIEAEQADLDRVLATVLVADIVRSTEHVARIGDHAWREVLEHHRQEIRGLLGRFRGVEVDTAGDGFVATFDGAARAVRCAQSIVGSGGRQVEVRVGCHSGEVERIEGRPGGLAVHIASHVCAEADPSEVLVTSTVRDLTVGSSLSFEDAGEHELKGVPDRWRLYRANTG